ncbi:hypothetical protein RYH80_14435 [Halobaculum sp. MBLA0147]|uniref:hypothetical protein n=1 Tax=Halobaculum sp. MBLA0147 TaxID=3079934 RepID=UPI00352439AB
MARRDQLDAAREESRARLENQRELLNNVGERAIRNIRLNLALVGLFLSVLGLSLGPSPNSTEPELVVSSGLLNAASYAALGVAAVSVFTGLVAYVRTPTVVGLGRGDIEQAIDYAGDGVDDAEFLDRVLRSHRKWMHRNKRANRVDTALLNVSLLTVVLELEYFGLSVLAAVRGESGVWVNRRLLVVTLSTLVPLVVAVYLKDQFTKSGVGD